MPDLPAIARAAADWIRNRWSGRPVAGIILGTGAGAIANQIHCEATWDYRDIPGFPETTAMGHTGKLIGGTISGIPVLAMQGRFHLYEGHDVDSSTIGVHVMAAMGIDRLFISNAAGGVSPRLARGEIVLLNSHIDFMYRGTPMLNGEVVHGRPLTRSDSCYDRGMIETAMEIARKHDFVLHEGVYASMLGPNYETRAEYRFLRRIGVDVVGMSTVPEAAVASRYGIKVLAMSIVTNVASPEVLERTSGQEVIDAGMMAAPNLMRIVQNSLEITAATGSP